MTAAENDVVIVLDICRLFHWVPTADDLKAFTGLDDNRLWNASQIISRSGLVTAPTGDAMVWPSNEDVLASYRLMRVAA